MRVFLSVFFILSLACVSYGADKIRAGNQAYDREKYGEAFDLYQESASESGKEKAIYNSGAALYRLKDYDASAQTYLQSAEEDGKLKQSSVYNAGNAFYMKGDREKAIEYFRKALVLNPADEEALHNLQFILESQENDDSSEDDNQNDEDDQENQEDQNEDSNDESNDGSNTPEQQEQQDQQDDSSQGEEQNSGSDSQQKEDENKDGGGSDSSDETKETGGSKLSKEEADNILQMLKDKDGQPVRPKIGAPKNLPPVDKDW